MKALVRSTFALMMCGILVALAVAPAHAGGGMGFGAGVTTCRAVSNGVRQPQTIEVSDDFGDTTVAVATAAFVCDIPATGNTVKGPDTVPGPLPGDPGVLVTCYTVRQGDRDRIPVNIQDAFGTQTNVNVGPIQLVCVPSLVNPVTPASPTP